MRARINDRLARAARFPVTMIVAPAGFGKSVALADFLETSGTDAVRYDVGREDGKLLAFVRGLSRALQHVAPAALASFPGLQERVLTAADPVRDITDWFDEHLRHVTCTIAVDDLHNAAGDPASIVLLADLIERTHERIRWLVATRSDARLPVASWIGYGRMDLPLGEEELRFTAGEALVTAGHAHAAVDPHEVEALRELTGGWPVALAIALRTRTHAADLRSAATGTREIVYRYLAEQVFAALDRAQQRFLLATCVFTSFDVAIAEELGATPEFLADLWRSVTFLTALSATEYRYHDLFRDFLERELRRSGAGEWFRALSNAGELLERRGDDAGALAAYARAGVGDAILRIVERSGFDVLERGEAETLATALDAVPDALRGQSASALGLGAMLEASRGNFELAERGFLAAIERAGSGDLHVALVHRYAVQLVRHGRDCVALLEPFATDPAVPLQLRVPMLGTLATAYVLAGRVDDGLATVQSALDLLEPFDDGVRARVYQQAAYVHQFAPSRERARTYAGRAAELALARNLYEVAARAYSVLYTIAYDDDDPAALLEIVDRLTESALKSASRQARVFGQIAAYELAAERGDEETLERLDRALGDAHALLPRARTETLLPAQALRAGWHGEFARAHALLAGTGENEAGDERRALRCAEIGLYAAAAGAHDAADHALRDARAALERCPKATRRVTRTHLFVALAELVRGHSAAAHRHLAEAERLLTPPMRRLRALAHAARVLSQVQLDVAERPSLDGALERLRAESMGGIARLLAALPFAGSDEHGYAQLTPSEREILQLLAKGASTKDVAARTGRSPQTVDTHIRSICRKLNCSGRREAVAIATGAGWVTV